MVAALVDGAAAFPPFTVSYAEVEPKVGDGSSRADARVTLAWERKQVRFAVEVCRLWSPKAFAQLQDAARRAAARTGLRPLVLVPYLGEEQLAALEAQSLSGLDLCGNGLVVVPGQWLVRRSGAPNRFRWEGGLKNVYRGQSSLAARLFLLKPEFRSAKEFREELLRRGGDVAPSTISKVCQGLEADLVVERGRGPGGAAQRMRLLQADKLLDLLVENYTPPRVARTFVGKLRISRESLVERLTDLSGLRICLTGAGSIAAYAVAARESMQCFYCSDLDRLAKALGDAVQRTARFADATFFETNDDAAYFDRRAGLTASPIQTYLELAAGEKRDRDAAVQVREGLLRSLLPGGEG